MPTRELFNAKSQQLEKAELSVDKNNEIIATFADGGFIKFPAGLSKDEFEAAIYAHQMSNEGQEVITPELEKAQADERANSEALIGLDTTNGNTMPGGGTNNDPSANQTAS